MTAERPATATSNASELERAGFSLLGALIARARGRRRSAGAAPRPPVGAGPVRRSGR